MLKHDNIIKISNLNEKEIWPYVSRSEVGLLRCNEPQPGIFVAESPNVIERAINAGYEPVSFLIEEKYLDGSIRDGMVRFELIERFSDVPVYTACGEVLKDLIGYKLTRGMLAAFKRKRLMTLSEIIKGKRRIAVLENIVNPTNIGAIFRSAAALKMDAVILSYGCSDPLYKRASRVAMGNVFLVPWTIMDKDMWPDEGMKILRSEGFKTAAMALCNDSVSIADKNLHQEEKLALILGTEGSGLLDETIKQCDYTVKIPMADGVDSLNVAAAAAVAFWELA
ncbi:MAG: RNA methyltransferase [Lachnospiraceae bacterium]|nr:RNA methyltransferase [Lachnobacterium sp.]MDD6138026.1 RNA methyltransferase [Lachnospiraceae bacterium]MDY6155481.1 RNA methyltransferase [Agathobacter sp.]